MEEQRMVDDQLRAWAQGRYSVEAATELLLQFRGPVHRAGLGLDAPG